jgi:uncharacterized protein (TIGR04255 family)
MAGGVRLHFDNLPLVEAAIRASFAQPVQLKFSAIADIRNRLMPAFPQITEPEVYETPPGVSEEVAIRPGSITGVVFAGNPKGLRCTFQGRLAVVRWLRQYVAGAPDYPRFEVLRPALWEVVEAVKAAYGLDSLPIAVVNMSYVNFIPVTDFSSVLGDYFSPLVHVRATENAEEIRKLEVSWRENEVDLRFHLEKVSATIGENTVDGCRLTTIAGMRVPIPDGDEAKTLEEVHDRLQVFFRDVISDHAKREWRLKGD